MTDQTRRRRYGAPKWACATVKGYRRWLRTCARNRARDWRKTWLEWRRQRIEVSQ